MLVCSVSQLRRRAAIAADVAETATAIDAPGTGNVVFATLVDDPASVNEFVDAYLGEIIVEAASASDTWTAALSQVFAADLTEVAAAADVPSVASAFTPATLTGLIGWWDASITASLTLSSTTVTRMADQSGAGNHIGDGVTTSNRPLYEATGMNARPCVVLGSFRFLPCSPFPIGTGNSITVFAVANLQACQYGRLLSYAHPGASHDYDTAGSFNVGSGPTTPTVLITRLNANVAIAPCTYDPAIHRMIFTISAAGATTTYVDGVATTGTALPGNWITGGQLALGKSMLDGFTYAGRVSEIGIATGFSDAATVAQLDTYLKTKWGL